MFDQIGVHPQLLEHSQEFATPQVLRVTKGVYVAIGFDLANCVMLEGDEGIVIVDTLSCVEAAEEVLAAFRTITQKPVKGIIYTHNHTDHIFGAGVFAREGDDVMVIGHETLSEHVARVLNVIRPVIGRRSMRQFGGYLGPGGLVNAGIGPHLRVKDGTTFDHVRPTKTFRDRISMRLAGVDLELIHAPGETDDTSYVWLPEKRCLISADNIYKTFPNLYAIRGTAYRDVMQWVGSLDKIRDLAPDILVPMHTRPLFGRDEIRETVTLYRDAIQFVHDQTIRYINQGLTPDEIVTRIELPEALAGHRYLRQHYGTIEWSVRAIFEGYLGWFDGNPARLDPHPPLERAKRMADLAGGVLLLRQRAERAAAVGDWPWVLELTDHLRLLVPDDSGVGGLRRQALVKMGERHISANGRNYFLMSAQESAGFQIPAGRPQADALRTFAIESFFDVMRVRLNPDKCAEKELKIGFVFTDSGKTFTLHVRHGILEIKSHLEEGTVAQVHTTEQVWKEVASQLKKPLRAVFARELQVRGSVPKLISFLGMFR